MAQKDASTELDYLLLKFIEKIAETPELWDYRNEEWQNTNLIETSNLDLSFLGSGRQEDASKVLHALWTAVFEVYVDHGKTIIIGDKEVEFSKEIMEKLRFLDYYKLQLLDVDKAIELLEIIRQYPVLWRKKADNTLVKYGTWCYVHRYWMKKDPTAKGLCKTKFRYTWYYLRDLYVEELVLDKQFLMNPIFKPHMMYLNEIAHEIKEHIQTTKGSDDSFISKPELVSIMDMFFNSDLSFETREGIHWKKYRSLYVQATTPRKKSTRTRIPISKEQNRTTSNQDHINPIQCCNKNSNKDNTGSKEVICISNALIRKKLKRVKLQKRLLSRKLKTKNNKTYHKSLERTRKSRQINNFCMSMADIANTLPEDMQSELQKQISTLMEFEENEYEIKKL